ncbi:MAG TPA: nuclear transport factor 2 family protein [Trebonia sp.]|jgi:ketosteroid isomerase-like protein|nr:nuclear transport factor 2 family protein [Trebonia sp.]
MSASTGSARKIAEEYVRAWLSGDVDTAMSLIADDIVGDAPTGQIVGRAAYRQFLEPFATSLLGSELTGVLGDDEHAAAAYVVQTPFARDFRGMEYLTVDGGKITRAVSVFDTAPIMRARAAAKG